MDMRILFFFMVMALAACSSSPPLSPAPPAPTATTGKGIFVGGNGLALASNDIDSQPTASKPRVRAASAPTRQVKPPAAKSSRDNPSGKPDHGTDYPPAFSQGLSYWVERLNPDGSKQRANASTVFRGGDRITLHVRSSRAGYLYVVSQGTDGQSSFIFPAAANGNEHIESNQPYRIPASGFIRFDNQPGQEVVWLFLSQHPLPVDAAGHGQSMPSDSPNISAQPVRKASYATCGKNLVLESPAAAQSACGVTGKNLKVEDDTQRPDEPATKVSVPTELLDGGQVLSLRLTLQHE